MDRKEAISIIVKSELVGLSKEMREELLLGWWGIDMSDEEFSLLPMEIQNELLQFDEPTEDVMHSKYNPLIIEALKYTYLGIRNEYLSEKVRELTEQNIEVKGEVEVLKSCPCCGYQTIAERGQYEICSVCHWEDDGIDDLFKYSSPNHMSIQDYKRLKMKIDEDMSKRYVNSSLEDK
ncbi:CPCC family cysteine-rich protein [Oceanirhabdus sp. W0125-5]|uniref:CPCC family cysteine-rich protein n=1 Tax=Oceanirhabdus sp. W0125-5 TaxID=2999116 RepID=UPI0022F2FF33|nr:CPCC family cysteine-rich protein [Oceanirhabdus sp. W0125-5]WBW96088.1 CPCC family cysteine-rich protein [Oceanirhabdus sp. W0125-5]